MKVYAKAYKTYEGARRRMLHEKATHKGDFVWGVKQLSFDRVDGSDFRVVRTLRAEHERMLAVITAKQALGLEDSLS